MLDYNIYAKMHVEEKFLTICFYVIFTQEWFFYHVINML